MSGVLMGFAAVVGPTPAVVRQPEQFGQVGVGEFLARVHLGAYAQEVRCAGIEAMHVG
jgi:hypothetical protein